MKKLAFLLMLLLVPVLLFGCNKADEDAKDVDMDLVGAWQLEDENQIEYYIFTEDSKVCIARGTVYFEGDATFVKYADGSRKYFSNFYYMSGELNYTVDGDTVTFDDGTGTVQVFKKADYSAPELKIYEDFNSKNPLVGTWYNEEYNDTYTFNADGTASYSMDFAELEYVSHIDYTYNEKDGTIYFTYDAGAGSQEITDTYTIAGDVLSIAGSGEYIRQ